jgi:hypothetical protein
MVDPTILGGKQSIPSCGKISLQKFVKKLEYLGLYKAYHEHIEVGKSQI